MTNAKLNIDGREFTFPVVVGSEDERGIEISTLRTQTGAITLDSGYGNTGACETQSHLSTAKKAFSVIVAIPSSNWPSTRSSPRWPTCSSTVTSPIASSSPTFAMS